MPYVLSIFRVIIFNYNVKFYLILIFRHNSTIFLNLVLYYLYGDNMIEDLPKSLKRDEVVYYFKKYDETGNEEYREKLIVHNLRLVSKIVFNDFKDFKYDKDEMFSIGVEGLIKAVDNYDFRTGYLFSTFASVCIRNSILMYFRREKKYSNDVSIYGFVYRDNGQEIDFDEYFTDGKRFEDDVEEKEFFDFVKGVIDGFDEEERFIIKSRVGLGCNRLGQREIGGVLGCSQSYVSRLEKSAFDKLREEIARYDNSLVLRKKKVLYL